MVEQLMIGGIIALLATVTGMLIVVKIQRAYLAKERIEHRAWQDAQEGHQRLWEAKQGERIREAEQKLTRQVGQLQEGWRKWETKDDQRLAKLNLEYELARIPRVEDAAPLSNGYGQFRQPPSFYKANLSGLDFSHRYLGFADLREAQLADTNFYMADLSGANLSGANLTGANLAGANLAKADLRGTILTGANMLVADLHNAILNGAHLLSARNFTVEQLLSAIYDNQTQIDPELDITFPRLPSVRASGPKALTDVAPFEPSPAPGASIDFDIETKGPLQIAEPEEKSDIPLIIQQPLETPLLLPQPSGDNQHDPGAANLQKDRPGNKHTDEFGRTMRKTKYNGKRRAKAS